MSDMSELVRVRKHREAMLDTYIDAIRQVGGSPAHFLETLETMTVAEMMEILAQNYVRFTVDMASLKKARKDITGTHSEENEQCPTY